MSQQSQHSFRDLSSELLELAVPLCNEFEKAWQENANPNIADYVARVPADHYQEILAVLIHLDAQLCTAMGQRVAPKHYLAQFPNQPAAVEEAFKLLALEQAFEPAEPTEMQASEPQVETTNEIKQARVSYPGKIGRYEVDTELGSGGFGVVCLANDAVLGRPVALKFARKDGFRTEAHVSAFIREARTVAQLQHPGIVTVYDVLQSGEWVCIVQQYIDSGDLRTHLTEMGKDFERIVQILLRTVEALAFAHDKGIVHCDIKPANILMDKLDNTYIADFGLAVCEYAQRQFAGTPCYMPPELVMGEKHRIDARCDIWSLGVMMYEMLTGVRPFSHSDQRQLFEQIKFKDPKPPRQLVPKIPTDLERICLKCLSKPLSERYRNALDVASDLQYWLNASQGRAVGELISTQSIEVESQRVASNNLGNEGTESQNEVRVVPKGLQSYDAHDAEFFLQLIPGPRDRHGFPDSVRFWRNWIQGDDPQINSVGLIYGPSGCGKSSFVKAGLLPNLDSDVVPVYVESTHQDMESRVVAAIRRSLPKVGRDMPLTKVVERIREGSILPLGKKLLLVFDQFEQWLNDRVPNKQDELVTALRQCDGQRVQSILLVRDDFWLATSRFMQEIEIELQQGRNAKLIDLFDLAHASKVLIEFGRNYGGLPKEPQELSKQQKRFVEQAVEGLAEQGRVISIRLAVFAEMFRGKEWSLAELGRMGGTQGVGVKFLENSFDSVHANVQHRSHQAQAKMLLEALIPQAGQQIRGRVLPDFELQKACGLTNKNAEFRELVRILDQDLRLITPTRSPVAFDESESSSTGTSSGVTYYQLTHDFLVASLRDWLTQNRRATYRGRAELRLAERCDAWVQQPESRQLPSGLEFLLIRLLTQSSRWNPDQTRMMKSALKHYGLRWGSAAALLLVGWWAFSSFLSAKNSENMISRLLQADSVQVPGIIAEMRTGFGVLSKLDAADSGVIADRKKKLHLDLARFCLGGGDSSLVETQLANCSPSEVFAITQATLDRADGLVASTWKTFDGADLDASNRIALAAALAQWDPKSIRWSTVGSQIRDDLLLLSAAETRLWCELLQPINDQVMPDLIQSIANLDSEHDSLMNIYNAIAGNKSRGRALLLQQVDAQMPTEDMGSDEYIRRSNRQARLAVTLIGLGVEDDRLWQFLKCDQNMTRRSFMIECFARFGVNPRVLVTQLSKTTDPEILAGLMLSLGSWRDLSRLPSSLFEFAERQHRESVNASVHGAAEWLLNSANRKLPDVVAPPNEAKWKVIHPSLTLVSIAPESRFKMSDDLEGKERIGRIDRPFWISTTEIPIELYRQFDTDYAMPEFDKDYAVEAVTEKHPVTDVDWNDAGNFCNWLTQQQGLPPAEFCFEPNSDSERTKREDNSMRLVTDWRSKKGFRLPTEEEWELACKSENPMAWSCGRDPSPTILGRYAWYLGNNNGQFTTRRVASFKPNSNGLFDMHGNANELTLEFLVRDGRNEISVKGGCYHGSSQALKPSYPRHLTLGSSLDLGFRVVQNR